MAETAVGEGFSLLISGMVDDAAREKVNGNSGKVVMLVGSDCLGQGPEELGRLLMKNYLITLLDLQELPDAIFFINTGVLLTTAGSEVIEALERLQNLGCEIYSCGVCLDFFHCKDKLVVGTVTNMFTIAESMLRARSAIRL